jgi:galactose oxidase
MWDPATEAWTLLDQIDAPRNYHSVALLLPDGRVFSGGGGLCGTCNTNNFNGQILTPPNLYGADGNLAARPTIAIGGATVAFNGDVLTVTSSERLKSVSIIRFGSATHSTNTDQRRLELCGPAPTACDTSTSNTVTIPADAGIALPGYWMVFGVNMAGVPSVSKTVLVGTKPATAVQRTAALAGPTVAGGNAEPINTTFAATDANPAIAMPASTQKD